MELMIALMSGLVPFFLGFMSLYTSSLYHLPPYHFPYRQRRCDMLITALQAMKSPLQALTRPFVKRVVAASRPSSW